MLTKQESSFYRFHTMHGGMAIEFHVSNWFQEKWPEFWKPPDNEYNYKVPCDHDFKLALPDRVYGVDVAGPLRDGTFGTYSAKLRTDLRVFAEMEPGGVYMRGVMSGQSCPSSISPLVMKPCTRMFVWLNCVKFGFPYEKFCGLA